MNKKEQTPGILIMASYYKSINRLSSDDQLIMYQSIMEFGFNGIEPEFIDSKKYLYSIWDLIEPTIAKGISTYNARVSAGALAGKAKAANAKAAKVNTSTETPSTKEQKIEEPKIEEPKIEEQVDEEIEGSTEQELLDVIEVFKFKNMTDEEFIALDILRDNLVFGTNASTHSKKQIELGLSQIKDKIEDELYNKFLKHLKK